MSPEPRLYHRRSRPIGLTSLIDVVFILLLFFMLTTQFAQWRAVPLRLAEAGGGAASAAQGPLHLYLLADGGLYLGPHGPLSPAQLGAALAEGEAATRGVALHGHPEQPLQGLIDLIERLTIHGITQVELADLAAPPTP